MVNFKKLADRAQKVKTAVESQGGTDALKEKAQRMKTAAAGQGSVGDKAKAAAQVAREKPNPTSETTGEQTGARPDRRRRRPARSGRRAQARPQGAGQRRVRGPERQVGTPAPA